MKITMTFKVDNHYLLKNGASFELNYILEHVADCATTMASRRTQSGSRLIVDLKDLRGDVAGKCELEK